MNEEKTQALIDAVGTALKTGYLTKGLQETYDALTKKEAEWTWERAGCDWTILYKGQSANGFMELYGYTEQDAIDFCAWRNGAKVLVPIAEKPETCNKADVISQTAIIESVPGEAMEALRQERARVAAEAIWRVFTWSESSEGHDYWETIWRRLRSIAHGEPLNILSNEEYGPGGK